MRRARWKRKNVGRIILTHSCQDDRKTGVARDGAVETWQVSAGCAVPLRNKDGTSPHLGAWERLSGWSSHLTSYYFRAPRFAQRWLIRGRQSGSGWEKQVKSVLQPSLAIPGRGPRTETFSKAEPAPNASTESFLCSLLLGLHVSAQT